MANRVFGDDRRRFLFFPLFYWLIWAGPYPSACAGIRCAAQGKCTNGLMNQFEFGSIAAMEIGYIGISPLVIGSIKNDCFPTL